MKRSEKIKLLVGLVWMTVSALAMAAAIIQDSYWVFAGIISTAFSIVYILDVLKITSYD